MQEKMQTFQSLLKPMSASTPKVHVNIRVSLPYFLGFLDGDVVTN
jgi:hypothetical protein